MRKGKTMAKWTNLEINDLQVLTNEEIRDVVAHFTTIQAPLSERQVVLLQEAELWLQEDEVEMRDYWNDIADDVEADADALISAGMGTDEDYGYYGGDEY